MPRALIWRRGEALYIGPAVELQTGPSETLRVYIPLDGELVVDEGVRRLRAEVGGALITSGGAHRTSGSASRVACFFLDRVVYPPSLLQRRLATPAGLAWIRSWRSELGELTAGDEPLRPDAWPRLFGPLPPSDRHDATARRLERGLRVLRRDPSAAGALDRAAAAAGWSRSRFRHIVRQRTGLSLKRYRLWAKLARALALTIRGCNMTQAALEAGFSSSSHFSAAHAAMFGMTPSNALRRLRASETRASTASRVAQVRPDLSPTGKPAPGRTPSYPVASEAA